MDPILRFKLVFFSPIKDTDSILSHLFSVVEPKIAISTVGRIGNYERCAYRGTGEGQFLPLNGARPSIGEVGQVCMVEEDKVETYVMGDVNFIRKVVQELKHCHPYEEVAYEVYTLENF